MLTQPEAKSNSTAEGESVHLKLRRLFPIRTHILTCHDWPWMSANKNAKKKKKSTKTPASWKYLSQEEAYVSVIPAGVHYVTDTFVVINQTVIDF